MKRPSYRLPAALLALALALGSGALAAPESKPRIMILATGGTIAGAQASAAEAGYKSGTFSVDDLIKAVPKLKDLAEITADDLDALVFPGGFGAAKNLSDYAFKGAATTVHAGVAKLLREMHARRKPIGLACITLVTSAGERTGTPSTAAITSRGWR